MQGHQMRKGQVRLAVLALPPLGEGRHLLVLLDSWTPSP